MTMTDTYGIAEDNYRYFRYCRDNGHDQYLLRAEMALAYFVGQQWTQEELSQMKATNRPALTINKMFRTIDTLVGYMMQGVGDVRFAAANDAATGDAGVLDKLWVHTEQTNHLRDRIDRNVMLAGLLTGRGFYDIRATFDDQMQGSVGITMRRPQNVILDPENDQVDPATWSQVFNTFFLNYEDISLMYGEDVAKELQETPQASWLAPYDLYAERALSMRFNGGIYYDPREGDPKLVRARRLIERQYKTVAVKEFFVDTQTGDMSMVPPGWKRDRIQQMLQTVGNLAVTKKRTEIIRWRVTCDRFVLHDAESPYKRFTIVPFMPYFIDGYTYSLGELLLDNQRLINKMTSQVLHILNSAANSGWKVKANALKNMTEEELQERGASTGLVAVLDDVENLQRIQPGQMPQGHDTFLAQMQSTFYEIAGYTDVMRGEAQPHMSGKVLNAGVERSVDSMEGAFSAFNMTRGMLAEAALDLYQEYYTEPRVIRIAGDSNAPAQINTPQPDGTVLNDITVGKYIVTVVPAPQRRLAEQNAFDQLVTMRRELNIQIPDDVIINHSALPNKQSVVEGLTSAQASSPAAQQQQAMLSAELAERQASVANKNAQTELAQARAARARADAAAPDHRGAQVALDAQRMGLDHHARMADIGLRREISANQTAASLAATRAKVHDATLKTAADLVKGHQDRDLDLTKHTERLAADVALSQQPPTQEHSNA